MIEDDEFGLAEPGDEVLSYEFRFGDVIGIGFTWAGNVLNTTGGAMHAIGREFYAATNKRRQQATVAAERRTLEEYAARLYEEGR